MPPCLPPHPEGQFAATCVDIVDLGERVETYPGSPPRIVRKVVLVFATASGGKTTNSAP